MAQRSTNSGPSRRSRDGRHPFHRRLHIILTPILLGAGKTVFGDITKRYPLKLLSTKSFKSGNVVVTCEPALR